jgi:hypothetical protein
VTSNNTTGRERVSAKHLPKALLGYVLESRLADQPPVSTSAPVSSPWDVWWVCYRARLPLNTLDVPTHTPGTTCAECERDARALAATEPPGHPDMRQARQCTCLLEWAVRMRAPATPVDWPPMTLTLALIKPGAPRTRIRTELEKTHDVLSSTVRTLETTDTRRLYPEAYGAGYVAARDTYLTCAPVQILVLAARTPATETFESSEQIKARIRRRLGGGVLRNNLHMPDNPGEVLADIAHLAGEQVLADFYGRYDRDAAPDRLAFYRTALGIGKTRADRARARR